MSDPRPDSATQGGSREITLTIRTPADDALVAARGRAAGRGCRKRAILDRVRIGGRRDVEDMFPAWRRAL